MSDDWACGGGREIRAMTNMFAENVRSEIDELRQHYPALKDEDLFLVWFLRAYVTEDLEAAARAITNGPKDKGVDAVLVDDSSRSVFVIQGKYRHKPGGKGESRQDVMGFAQLAQLMTGADSNAFREFLDGADATLADKLSEARQRLARRGYRLWFYYVTSGRVSPGLRKEAETTVRSVQHASYMDVLDARRLELLMRDYLDGVAPPIPSLDLVMENGQGISVNGILQRYDARSKIESWVFSMQGDAIADLFESGGKRLFARNIRGFLGESTEVNRSMEYTLRNEPERFFYYNNGITILCDEAKRVSSQGKDVLRVSNPQVINGQQTTRTLARLADQARKASVVVRVIQVPRGGSDGESEFDALVSKIVEGTNWQNFIRSSDLVANDRRQVDLQRELRKRGYLYLRKRESKGEARRAAGSKHYKLVKKEDLARAVAGCDLDPVEARSGVENLFEDDKYACIFPNADPRYYLTRYWTMREVTYCAREYPQRGYAKWLVQWFVWSQLAPLIRSASAQDRFIHLIECEDHATERALIQAIDKVFVASLAYWRKNRGKGAKALDPSTFFRNKRGRHMEFRKFWSGTNNKSRPGFKKSWSAFARALAEPGN